MQSEGRRENRQSLRRMTRGWDDARAQTLEPMSCDMTLQVHAVNEKKVTCEVYCLQILPYAVLWIHWLPRYTQILIEIIALTTGLPMLALLACLAKHNLLRAFLVVSLNSLSSGSMKWIPRNLPALPSFGFSLDQLCFSFSLAFLHNSIQSSGHKRSGLDVTCRLVKSHTGPHTSVWRFLF